MKLQYLGDSKDSFKWDYHDYLTVALKYQTLTILLMMTPDDESNNGESNPECFPARKNIIDFCNTLRAERNLSLINNLPIETGSEYVVNIHKPQLHITNRNRNEYFSGVNSTGSQVVFIDPDNGFEPEKSHSEKHVLYSDIFSLLGQISDNSVISVFQHFRRIPFEKDFLRIRERISYYHATAIYWHSLMFVTISKSENIILSVRQANMEYQKSHPVNIVG